MAAMACLDRGDRQRGRGRRRHRVLRRVAHNADHINLIQIERHFFFLAASVHLFILALLTRDCLLILTGLLGGDQRQRRRAHARIIGVLVDYVVETVLAEYALEKRSFELLRVGLHDQTRRHRARARAQSCGAQVRIGRGHEQIRAVGLVAFLEEKKEV